MEILHLGALATARIAMNKPFTRELMAREAPGVPHLSRHFAQLWPQVEELTLLDEFRADAILSRVEQVAHLPGDLIECGCGRGGISLLIGLLIRRLKLPKKILLLDSFEGLPAPDPAVDGGYSAGQFAASRAQLESSIERLGLEDICEVRAGWFSDTLPEVAANRELCFGHIDCDLHHSARECLEHLHPRLPIGGVLVIDDYHDGSGGVMSAVDSWLEGLDEILELGPAPQVAVARGCTTADSMLGWSRVAGRGSLALSTDVLGRHDRYQHFLQAVHRMHAAKFKELGRFVEVCRGNGGEELHLHSPEYHQWTRALFSSE